MNNELIKITEKDGKKLVSARELHEFLENKRQFTDWIKQRIEQYDFIENVDFSISQICEKGGRPKNEYAITIDMAKELSMVENNEKGKEARKYFIQCEKKLKQQPQLPQDYLSALKALVASEEEKQKLALENTLKQQHIDKLKPKAHYADVILANNSLVNITAIAKDYGMSGVKMNELLHQLGVQYKQAGQWFLYSQHQAEGYVSSQTIQYQGNGKTGVSMHTQWTQRGRKFIYDLLKGEGILPLIERNNLQIA